MMINALNKNMIRLFLGLVTSAIYIAAFTPAFGKNCTISEKKVANDHLENISRNFLKQGAAERYHLPFGLHTNIPLPSTSNQRQIKKLQSQGQILYQNGYIMEYDVDVKISRWVSYQLTARDRLHAKNVKRRNCFRPDPRLKGKTGAVMADYSGSGYDRGHLANDADLKDDPIDQLNTYMLSNTAPQTCHLNRGIWLSLEKLTRRWAEIYDTIYITSGPIFDYDKDGYPDTLTNIPKLNNRVGIASHYFKTILRRHGNNWHSISFILPNDDTSSFGSGWDKTMIEAVKNSIISSATLKTMTGIKFHPQLDGAIDSIKGENWNFHKAGRNFLASC